MKTLIAAVLVAGAALQPGSRPAPRPQPAQDRAAMRVRLERRLDEIDRLRDRVEEAIRQLDKGEPLDSVRAEVLPPGARGARGGADGGGAHDGPPPLFGPPDPDADRRLVLSFLDEHDPAGAQRMRDVLRDRPEDGARWLARSAARVHAIVDERDDALRGLRLKEYLIGRRAVDATRRLGDALASPGNDADVAAARAGLSAVLGEQFDLRMSVARREIEVLEDRVTQLRRDLAEQQDKRREFIDSRTERLIQATREWAQRERGGGRPPQQK